MGVFFYLERMIRMQKNNSEKRIYLNAILIIGIVVFGLIWIYIRIMQVAYQNNINCLTQSLIEVEQSKLKNDVNELMIRVNIDFDYLIEDYNKSLNVVDSILHEYIIEKSEQDEDIMEMFIFLTSVYKDLQIRVYDQHHQTVVAEFKQNNMILAQDILYSDLFFDLALWRQHMVEEDRYIVIIGISDSDLKTMYKGMLKDAFDENPNLTSIYTLIEIVDYKGGDKFAKVIQGISVSPSCARQGCYINTTYQDDRGRYVLEEMLEGLKDNGTYFGYVQNNDNQDMLYAELYAPYDLVVLTSTPMKDFYLQTMSEFKAFEQNFETQIHVAIGIACASFIIAILGGIATFKYMKSKEVENEREQNRMIIEHNKVLLRKNDQINQLAHDIKNHLICIKGFINQQTPEEASRYIDSVYEDLNQLSAIVITGNRLVDIILNDKISQMKKIGITFTKRIEHVSLDFVDFKEMTIILTNMLDNAIESCEKSEQKEIQFTISSFNQTYIIIKVVNSCDVAPIISKGKLKSTKTQKGQHGYGVENIKRAVAKYNGSTYFDYDECRHQFLFSITLEKPQ